MKIHLRTTELNSTICTFQHPGTLTLTTERQSARMSKIANDGITRSGRMFIDVPIWQQYRYVVLDKRAS